jgi:hypothetical protein
MPEPESRASIVLSQVLERASAVSVELEIFDSWTEGELTVCVVYQSSEADGLLGLRREVETDVPVDAVAMDIVWDDLIEPLGRQADGLMRDGDGIMWWPGTRPEWRHQAMRARGH